MNTPSIRTDRLELIAASLADVLAELEGGDALARRLSVDIPSSWPPGEYDRNALEYFKSKLEVAEPEQQAWYGWYAISMSNEGIRQSLIAAAGYLGPPDPEGTVEIGYSVVPEARGKGYAAEIVEALVTQAFQTTAVSLVIAHTEDANIASAAVLSRCGFHVGSPGPEPGTHRHERSRLAR